MSMGRGAATAISEGRGPPQKGNKHGKGGTTTRNKQWSGATTTSKASATKNVGLSKHSLKPLLAEVAASEIAPIPAQIHDKATELVPPKSGTLSSDTLKKYKDLSSFMHVVVSALFCGSPLFH